MTRGGRWLRAQALESDHAQALESDHAEDRRPSEKVRATAHSGSEMSSEALIAQEGRQMRHLAIKDMEDRLVRLERVLAATASLLRESGMTETGLEAKTLELARERYRTSPQE